MSKQAMYDIIAIGNPLYNKYITDYQQSANPVLSGPSVSICSTASSLGRDNVVLIGALGNDYRDRFASDVEEYGIQEYLAIDSKDTTSFQLTCDGSNIPSLNLLNSADEIRIRDIPEEFLDSKIIAVTPVYREIDVDFISWLADSSDATLIIDPIGMARRTVTGGEITVTNNGGSLPDVIGQSDIVKMNWDLWRKFASTDDPLLAAEFLVETGAEIAIISLQNDGFVVHDGTDFLTVPYETIIEKNPLGAEDAFLGGFISGHLQQQSLIDCAILGSSVASIVLEQRCTSFNFDMDEVHQRKELIETKVEIR
ncbi:MAG: carbohydrate kinase family protein [Candidatus Thorarchaeota archaeon]